MASILVVEDDLAVRQTIEVLLAEHVVSFAGTKSALAGLTGECCEAVILDLTLSPKIDAELIAEIARRRPGVKILLMSGSRDAAALAGIAAATGAADFIIKPFDPTDFVAQVTRMLGRSD